LHHVCTEISLGELLGTGGFSNVHSIESIQLKSDSPNDYNEYNRVSRKKLAQTCIRSSDSYEKNMQYKYVFKALKPDLHEGEHNKGTVDLAVEARFLATFSHKHILAMRATADVDQLEPNFFVVLDRLEVTLDKKLQDWRKRVSKSRGLKFFYYGCCVRSALLNSFRCFSFANKYRLHELWMERLTVAKEIASAIQYLHARQIVYRDLKPDNIGFNYEGEVKIFDFGLAKRLQSEDRIENELYNLTGNTGSLRYMAPEVARGQPYDERVDAYSFGILFWQLCALSTPYSGYTCKMHADLVVDKGYRPDPDSSWQKSWSDLMSECWDENIYYRPNFNYIVEALETEIMNILKDDGFSGNSPEMLAQVKPRKKNRKVKAGRIDEDTRNRLDKDIKDREII